MSSFQICCCGSAPGYPHAADCPRPLFNATYSQAEQWEKDREFAVLVTGARNLARALNTLPGGILLRQAMDDSDPALAAAQVNYDNLRRISGHIQWCHCDFQNNREQAYFRDHQSGSHGWACCYCRGVTQIG